METASYAYQQPPPHQAHHQQPHMQGSYQPGQNGAAITSPSQQSMQPPQQSSPLMSQGNPYGQHGAPPAGHYQIPHNAGYAQMAPNMSVTQAAMMANVAATGPAYQYAMPQQAFPMGHDGKMDARGGRRTPPPGTMAQQMAGRRMSHIGGSPGVPQPQVGLQRPPTSGGPVEQHQASPDVATGADESPLYVNAKQFHRILKRRLARQKLEEQLRLTSKQRKPYLHESRHNHAMRRPRGPGGRFLTSDEVAELDKKKALEGGGELTEEYQKENSKPNGKRKSEGSSGPAQKRSRNNKQAQQQSEGEDDDDEADDD